MLLNKKMSALFLVFLNLSAQPLYEQQIVPFDAIKETYFGSSVLHSNTELFIGASGLDKGKGAVYIFKRENKSYSFSQKLFASDSNKRDFLGNSLLLHKGKLVVGAPNKRVDDLFSGIGSVYIFKNIDNLWQEKQIIRPPKKVVGSRFSSVTAAMNDYLIIGADKYDTEIEETGAVFVYIYINDKYELYQEIFPPAAQEGQAFGSDIAVKDNLLFLASVADCNTSGIYSGSLYIYEKEDSLWKYRNKLIPKPNSDLLGFGTSLAINDEYVFVGTSAIYGYNKPGKVFIYKYEGMDLELSQTIESGDNYFNDKFGISLAVKNDTLLVGALFDTTRTEITGSAYMFVKEGGVWIKKMKIVPSDPENANYFGHSLLLNRDEIFITAPETYVDDNYFVGKVYRYTDYPTDISEREENLIQSYSLLQNYPNPFNPRTKIKFTIPNVETPYMASLQNTKLIVYDILGRKVKILINKPMHPGEHEVTFDGSELPSGVYLYTLTSGGFLETKKMLILR